jgi:hypothetical protein
MRSLWPAAAESLLFAAGAWAVFETLHAPTDAAASAPIDVGARPRPASPTFVDEPQAAALLAEVRARLVERPFYAVGILTTRRGDAVRVRTLRLHFRGPGVSLASIEGDPRDDGTIALRRDGRVTVLLPRSDVVLDLPPSMGGDRLFGSDFAVDDLLALGGGPDLFAATFGADGEIDGVVCRRVELRPRTSASTAVGRVDVWIARDSRTPMRLEQFSCRGAPLRRVEMRGAGRDGPPTNWTAESFGPRAGTSELEFRFFERDPPTPDDFFTVEGLRRRR